MEFDIGTYLFVPISLWPEWAEAQYPRTWQTRLAVGKVVLSRSTTHRCKRMVFYKCQFHGWDQLEEVCHTDVQSYTTVRPPSYILCNRGEDEDSGDELATMDEPDSEDEHLATDGVWQREKRFFSPKVFCRMMKML